MIKDIGQHLSVSEKTIDVVLNSGNPGYCKQCNHYFAPVY